MAEPAYAVVDVRCPPSRLADLEAIPNFVVATRPELTENPDEIVVHALADEDAQAAAAALGVTVTVAKTAAEYQAQIDAAYASIRPDEDPGPVG
jgi:hypothetical protein